MFCCQVWPLLGLHFAAIAKLAAVSEDDAMAVHAASDALQVLEYTHPGSRITSDVLQLQHDAPSAFGGTVGVWLNGRPRH